MLLEKATVYNKHINNWACRISQRKKDRKVVRTIPPTSFLKSLQLAYLID